MSTTLKLHMGYRAAVDRTRVHKVHTTRGALKLMNSVHTMLSVWLIKVVVRKCMHPDACREISLCTNPTGIL